MSKLDYSLPSSAGDRKFLGQIIAAAEGYFVTDAAQAYDGLTLVISNNTQQAQRIQNEVNFFNTDHIQTLSFPDWEVLPYDSFSPHQDIISERITTLNQLPTVKRGILIVPLSTLMHKIAPPSFFSNNFLKLKPKDKLDMGTMRQQLTDIGYHAVDTVYGQGEFAIRGSIIDLFPSGSEFPFRIELFDDEVETLRTFEPETQRSINQIKQIDLLPAKEFPFDTQAIQKFKNNWREQLDVDHRKCPLYTDISNGIAPSGIEYYLPLFFEQCHSFFSILPEHTQIIISNGMQQAAEDFITEVTQRYEQRRYNITQPVLPPEKLFLSVNELFSEIKQLGCMILDKNKLQQKTGRKNLPFQMPPELTINSDNSNPLEALQHFLTKTNDSILFCAESAGRRESLLELLASINIKPQRVENWKDFIHSGLQIAITEFPLERGLSLEGHYHLITETQLFGQQVFQRRRRIKEQTQADQVIKSLTELNTGSPVVHLEHGVGRYLGLKTIDIENETQEFIQLEYANNATLYVPVSSLHLINRYTGASDENAPLHRLGNDQWSKARQKAAQKAQDTAVELLDIYARRAARLGFKYTSPDTEYIKFAASFPFEETPDQTAAIENVIKDMQAPQPMDRLVCGDVGFGKTEVAMRAAFIAAQNSRQVAILVPTTLLAQQHYQNFQDRFADWAITIELISRFRSTKEQQRIQEKLAGGSIDIIIGTHKLISSKIKFNNLGLLIIDEEHRFGVQQKEKLKLLRTEVDILTLTATPIPRTLNMAMSGIRDLSIIATPPARRLSVKTFIHYDDTSLVKEAILRELLRGGQVYYLHNEVKTIKQKEEELTKLVPQARIGIGHGQMRERDLEQAMSDFYHKRYNLLLCTTIIETGIDIPNANTIIINRADKFGLAQLHQLRGRVGRSHHQAYAYLLTPHKKSMTKDALKRLEAIEFTNDLGAGFTLATHDLEIRGAGEILGEEQSGQIQNVGFSLYMEMLEQAVEAIKAGKIPNIEQPLQQGTEINLHLSALIPDSYLPDIHSRLVLYKRIANANSAEELKALQIEMIDRFGILPEPTKNLFGITELKVKAQAMSIIKIDAGKENGKIEFAATTKVDPLSLVKMVQNKPNKYKLEGADTLRFYLDMEKAEQRFQAVDGLLNDLAAK